MHCHGFFRGVLFTVIDAIVACFGHFVRFYKSCSVCDTSDYSVCVCVHVSIVVCMKLCSIVDDQ